VKSLKAITSADPNNAAAWRALGASETTLRHFRAAIGDYGLLFVAFTAKF
jgi:hypothetical protein